MADRHVCDHGRAGAARHADSRRVAGSVGERFPDQCVDAVADQFRSGADGVILHGASPSELESVVQAYATRKGPVHA